MLSLLLIIPIIGSITLLFVTDGPDSQGDKSKKIALATSLINLILSIYLWVQFDSSTSQYQFVYSFKELSYCHLNIGVDGISIYFVLLTTFITPIALLSNYNNINNNLKYFLISFLLLETLQIALFVVLDLLLFYVFFESVLPVLFIVIILYGSGEAKIRSALLFFLYTLAGSLFMLLAVLEISNYVGSTDFQLISLSEINLDSQKLLWLAFFLAFVIKTPLWPMTGWLYRAHADSPLAGSIVLAGTILKLATYGYLRVLINFLPDATHYFSPLVQTIALITIVYASLATIIQQDTKSLIAYSSICHMGVVVLGLFSNTIQGIEGAILLAVAHGFVSPALFICVGGVIYDRVHTRIINYIRGLVTYMPVFTILFCIFTLCNTGIPLSLNFLGEQMSLIGVWDRSPFAAMIGATGIVFSAAYSIYLYNRLSYGSYSPYLKPLKDINRREFVLLISLLIPTVLLGVYPNVILDTLHASVTTLLYNIPSTPFDQSLFENVGLYSCCYSLVILNAKSKYTCISTNHTSQYLKTLLTEQQLNKYLNWFFGFVDAKSQIGVKSGFDKVIPNLGVGAAVGTVASATLKASAGLPPMQRAVAIGGTAFVLATGTKLGLGAGGAIIQNSVITDSIKNSPHSVVNIDRIPSPDINIINSVLEPNDDTSPLVVLLNALLSLNILELFLFIILFYVLFNRYIFKYNKDFISKIVNKYMPNKIKLRYNKLSQKGVDYNNKFTTFMFIVISILFLLLILGNIFISAELCSNTYSYIEVHNHLKGINKDSVLLLIVLNNKLPIKNK